MQEFILQFLSDYTLIAPVLFILIRALAIIIPPIPGIAIDIPGLIAFGWILGFIYAEIGIMLGAMVAFWIARRFKEPLLKRFVSLQKLHEWEDKLSENQKLWTLVAIRLPTIPLFDYISYAAGLTRISSVKFFLSSFIGNLPYVFSVFYFGGLVINRGIFYIGVFIVALLILWLVFRNIDFSKYFIKASKNS